MPVLAITYYSPYIDFLHALEGRGFTALDDKYYYVYYIANTPQNSV